MSKKPPTKQSPKKDERPQRERFEDFAREHGATEDVLDKAMGDLAQRRDKQSN